LANATFRIPSKAVQYGYVELPVAVGEHPDAATLAAIYVNYVYAFQKEEQEAIKRLQRNPVTAPVTAAQPVTEEEAQRYLDEGLGGVTEVSKDAAPWDKPAVDSKPKPWENGSAAPAKPVVDEDW